MDNYGKDRAGWARRVPDRRPIDEIMRDFDSLPPRIRRMINYAPTAVHIGTVSKVLRERGEARADAAMEIWLRRQWASLNAEPLRP